MAVETHRSGQLWRGLKSAARGMRKQPTEAEDRLWQQLRNRGLGGYKFRRQHGISRYIVDFYCAQAMVAVELDGASHDGQGRQDRERDKELQAHGIEVIHVLNGRIAADLQSVLKDLLSVLEARTKGVGEARELPPNSLSMKRRGGATRDS